MTFIHGLRKVVKNSFPGPWAWLSRSYHRTRARLSREIWRFGSLEGKFTKIHRKVIWGSNESVSGRGSQLDQTALLRQELPRLFERYSIKSVLDIPCGDFNWMKETNLPVETYIGADIVASLIEQNNSRYGGAGRKFVKLDLTRDALPCCDLIFCRDVLVHFSFRDIQHALRNMKASGSRFLLTTTYGDRESNVDIFSGEWRALNLQAAPLRFPPPLELVNEHCPNPGEQDKSLALWRFQDLPL